jgi:hypothetical protein
MNTKKTILLIPFLFLLATVWAQQTPVANGGILTTDQDTIIFAIGQSFAVVTNDPATVSSGSIQPYQILVLPTGMEDVTFRNFLLKVYPNPTTKDLVLQVDDISSGDLGYQLYDLNGKKLQHGIIRTTETTVPTTSLHPGEYLLVITHKSDKVKTFKIIKK